MQGKGKKRTAKKGAGAFGATSVRRIRLGDRGSYEGVHKKTDATTVGSSAAITVVPTTPRIPKLPLVVNVPLRRKLERVLEAAQLCVSAKLHTSGLILLYCLIDGVAAICAEHPERNIRDYYTAWLDKYLLPESKIDCSAIDLWGARCGVVHTLGSESNHSRKGEARKIIYVNRGGERSTLEELERIRTAKCREEAIGSFQLSAERNPVREIIVEVDSLIEAIRQGITSMFREAQSDPILANRIREREARVFETISNAQGRDLLEWGRGMLTLADAPERELYDLERGGSCSGCGATATVDVRALSDEGLHFLDCEMCSGCADALGGQGAIRDFRKRDFRSS